MPKSNANILIVEDDRDLLAITKRFLESEGFAVDVAASAEEAYELLSNSAYALIVLDVNLPGDDGIELCRNLRKASSTPVLFASARVGDDARVLALEGGGDAYLTKPFSLCELLAQVKAMLSRTHANIPTAPNASIALDASAHRVFKNGTPVDLSPKEYELAAALMRNPGQALSKQQFLADVWGAFSDVEPQTVAVHMS